MAYVDDLSIVVNPPKNIICTLTNKHEIKLKGTRPIKYHLGCTFFKGEVGTICFSPKKYIDNMIKEYVTTFGTIEIFSMLGVGLEPLQTRLT